MNIPANIRTHVFYIYAIILAILCFFLWIDEHDRRLKAEYGISELQSHQAVTDANAKSQVRTIYVHAKTVTTPSQAIADIPDVSMLPISAHAIPSEPGNVSVAALPLYQELATCKEDEILFQACKDDLRDETTIVAVLKKKPSFWHRVKNTAIVAGTGIVFGVLLHL